MNLRMARPEDAGALLEIYRPYIATTVTFEYVCPSLEEFAGRIAHTLERYPYLVLEEEGRALGYAYAHRLAPRSAYDWSAELSIYLRRDARQRGVGSALYTALFRLLRLQNVRMVYALVTSPNPPSRRFHEKLGFRLAGTQHSVGYKNGQWLGVDLMERDLTGRDGPPLPVIPVGALPEEKLLEILDRCCPGE